MVFGWLRAFRRARIARSPVPGEWIKHLERNVPFFRTLKKKHRADFLEKLNVFAREKAFIAAGGAEITDEMKVVIAAAAVRLVLGLDLSYYDRLTEIVVYPSHYLWPESEGPVFGEVTDWIVVVLSWEAVVEGLNNPDAEYGDTATHEFAHVLDRAAGPFNGTPRLHDTSHYKQWTKVMSKHLTRLRQGRRMEIAVLDEYGELNEPEFFAVATEAFFDRPVLMRENLGDLYRELKRFYRVDPDKL